MVSINSTVKVSCSQIRDLSTPKTNWYISLMIKYNYQEWMSKIETISIKKIK